MPRRITGHTRSSFRDRKRRLFRRVFQTPACRLTCVVLLAFAVGCRRSKVDQALESDAHGYFCPKCPAKFYTDRDVFADVCPQCKSFEILEVMGFVCATDGQMTLAPRGRGAVACQRCRKPAGALALPREKDLKAWGAVHRSKADVSPK